MKKKVVITGLGLVSAYGTSIEDFRSASSNEPKVQVKKDWTMEDLGAQYHFQVPEYNIKDHFDKLRAPYPLKYSQLAMLGCKDAMKDAKLNDYEYDDSRLGLIIDTSLGASEASEDYLNKLFTDGPRKVRPFKFSQTVSNVCIGYTAREFKLRGPSSLLFGETSLSYGYDIIQDGKADIMICGGVDSIRDHLFGQYNNQDALLNCTVEEGASTNEQYKKDITSQKDKNVITIGEAASFIVLETLESAQRRNATIYAELVDYYVVRDREYKHFMIERNAADYAQSLKGILDRTQVKKEEVDMVVGSSYSPHFFKSIELDAIKDTWEDQDVFYTSVKPYIGETFSSSAQASVSLAACWIKDQQFNKANPMSEFYETPDNIHTEAKEGHEVKTAVINTIQLGGNNTSFILKAVS